jgi:hypothetical protein
MPRNWPMKPGYYWARWTVAATGTHEGDQLTPASEAEIVQVNANHAHWADNPAEDEALSVSVPGVRETQWRDGFVWGEFVSDLDAKTVTGHLEKPKVSGNDIADEIEAAHQDWRVGLSVKPKFRQHEMYYEPPAMVVAVHASGFGQVHCKDGVLVLEGRFGTRFLAPAEDWVTA